MSEEEDYKRCVSCELQGQLLDQALIVQHPATSAAERERAQIKMVFFTDQLDAVGWACKNFNNYEH